MFSLHYDSEKEMRQAVSEGKATTAMLQEHYEEYKGDGEYPVALPNIHKPLWTGTVKIVGGKIVSVL